MTPCAPGAPTAESCLEAAVQDLPPPDLDPHETVAVIDFETTGMAPHQGARATEIAAVLVRGGEVVGQFQSLMRTGVWVPPFIEALTGISNQMLRGAPPAEEVMRDVLAFTTGCPLVAHNASFDRGFWLSEARHAGVELEPPPPFACTVLLARRLFPEAPSHKLSNLTEWCGISRDGRAHRAMSDAAVTAQLWIRMQQLLAERFASPLAGCNVNHALMAHVQTINRRQLEQALARLRLSRRQSVSALSGDAHSANV